MVVDTNQKRNVLVEWCTHDNTTPCLNKGNQNPTNRQPQETSFKIFALVVDINRTKFLQEVVYTRQHDFKPDVAKQNLQT